MKVSKNRRFECLTCEGAHVKRPEPAAAAAFWRMLWAANAAYKSNKSYYRGLVVRAIEDGIVLYILVIACWTLAYSVGGILDKLGVG